MATAGLMASRRLGRSGLALRIASPSLRPRAAVGGGLAQRPWICQSCSKTVTIGNKPYIRLASSESTAPHPSFAMLDTFPRRHIGPDDDEVMEMLQALDPPAKSLDEFVSQVIPPDVLSPREVFPVGANKHRRPVNKAVTEALPESEVMDLAEAVSRARMRRGKSFIGAGWYGTLVPEVIKRNMLESPAWYTSYTPYQAEISQGRLESLLNFQTMVSDLTALPIANASLLDEGTAAAEALTMSVNVLPSARANLPNKVFIASGDMHPQTLSVMRGRAEGFGIKIETADILSEQFNDRLAELGDALVGVMVQYPDTLGRVHDFRALADAVHKNGVLFSVATDLLALTVLAPPGEWGADVAFGSAQRFGVPMGFGGPHAAFFAVTEKHKRKLPGRLVGVSKDRLGGKALRLALQTREQHIRRQKATSNVCTAQALLANMSAMYAVYHGPEGLKAIAEKIMWGAEVIRRAASAAGWNVLPGTAFDTVVVQDPGKSSERGLHLYTVGNNKCYWLRLLDQGKVGITIDETTTERDLCGLAFLLRRRVRDTLKEIMQAEREGAQQIRQLLAQYKGPVEIPEPFKRTSAYLTHPIFNSIRSETEMLRYIHHLQSKDLSLVHSMIPLGSCTMKLNGSAEMALITKDGFANRHPLSPPNSYVGYIEIMAALEDQLRGITGMVAVSLQPNSGAQGEFAGLRTIRRYHESTGQGKRDICLIPVSAHGTNPASAAMAGMRVVPIECDHKTGNLDLADLEAKCEQYADSLGAMMVTYPSTFGVFEPQIKKVCEIVHKHGGQVYMDGANMNAQIGLCSPGDIGADVCHLNLHKTFCIPHGGGGPGVGPICAKSHLIDFMPSRNPHVGPNTNLVSSSVFGSASILPISWAYNLLMGAEGLQKATKVTLLNANYILSRLRPHYKIVYTNEHGRCAHEFILDARPFHETAGVEAIDIAKRLQDYGFHAPTMSWPVANTLMIEPTESESKEELDRFVDTLISIRGEIREIEEGSQPREGNVLKMAPHPIQDIILGDGGEWQRPYSREKAAYPLPWLKEKKFWPTVARVDDAYGDRNLFCTCPPVEDTTAPVKETVEETTAKGKSGWSFGWGRS